MQQYEIYKKMFLSSLKPSFLRDLVDCFTSAHSRAFSVFSSKDRVGYYSACTIMSRFVDLNIEHMLNNKDYGVIRRCEVTPINHYPYSEYIYDEKLIFHIKKVSTPNEVPAEASMRTNNADRNQGFLFEEKEINDFFFSQKAIYGILTYSHDVFGITSLNMGFPRHTSDGRGWLGEPINLMAINSMYGNNVTGILVKPTGPTDDIERLVVLKEKSRTQGL